VVDMSVGIVATIVVETAAEVVAEEAKCCER